MTRRLREMNEIQWNFAGERAGCNNATRRCSSALTAARCRQRIEETALSKKTLVDALVKHGHTVRDANAALDLIVKTITKELKKGQKFTLTGFGTFSISKRGARKGRNPRTGEAIKIKATKRVRFKAGATLKDAI
jgi:DNA-binding protein HU-beta